MQTPPSKMIIENTAETNDLGEIAAGREIALTINAGSSDDEKQTTREVLSPQLPHLYSPCDTKRDIYPVKILTFRCAL